MNHEERSSKNINPCTRKSAQRTNTYISHYITYKFMCMSHKERSNKSINSYTAKSAQRINTCATCILGHEK